jgi:hypothetical protein
MRIDKNYPSLQQLIYALQFIKPTEAWELTVISPVNPWKENTPCKLN